MRIKKSIERIPGGLMLVPLFLGALCHTFTPDAGKFFGSFTNGLITGTVPILSVWFFCMGAGINIKSTGIVLRKSGTIVITKILVAWCIGMLCTSFMPSGMIQTGFFAGLSTLAIVTSMDMTNGGLYASIMQQYGTKEEAGAFVLTSIESGPLVTMIILGSTGAAYFEPRLFVGAVLPFIIGFILGNLDPELRSFFGNASMTMIPFFGFALGNTIDLAVIQQTGLLGILLGLGVIVVTGIPLILADKFIGGGHGGAGLAASSSAGAAVTNPTIIAQMVPEFAPIAAAATALVATSVVVTSIVVPIITAAWCNHFNPANNKKKDEDAVSRLA
ncbi:2-keto-3-deoxygluconate transporter [Pectinatus cerevisiiphilus]|uniref:2-keto-3-deoxygluconate permease n=1 Tax=Pectinatus cerevisiiphilus TaxID=86956 RepID=A0A4R3KAS8_9FIRM|nr:2-keto-3-deoxygluconate transporter [Pectinatus cerevisiiphilus]TCS80117.1 2-keto-3-deoxygluconate permease [Pectinatus cerevisiiphilus]